MTNKNNFSILPLFPTTLGAVNVSEDLSNLEKIKQFEYTNLASEESVNSFKTEDNQILSKFPKEKEILLSYFNNFKNDILELKENEFAISSSWATRVEQNGFCQLHDHKNSFYSGVLYFDSVDANVGGDILFQNPISTGSFLLNPVEWNTFNFETYHLTPEKNLLILFPSYLKHLMLFLLESLVEVILSLTIN